MGLSFENRGDFEKIVGRPILAAAAFLGGQSRLKAGCGQDCPPHNFCRVSGVGKLCGIGHSACLVFLALTACARYPDFSRRTGVVELPAGTLILHRELTLPEGTHNLEIRGNPSGSPLRAAADFQGRALIYSKGATDLRLAGFRIDGNRAALEKPIGLPPSDVPFARYYRNNGILVEGATRLVI